MSDLVRAKGFRGAVWHWADTTGQTLCGKNAEAMLFRSKKTPGYAWEIFGGNVCKKCEYEELKRLAEMALKDFGKKGETYSDVFKRLISNEGLRRWKETREE
jgi:hypothetical protein